MCSPNLVQVYMTDLCCLSLFQVPCVPMKYWPNRNQEEERKWKRRVKLTRSSQERRTKEHVEFLKLKEGQWDLPVDACNLINMRECRFCYTQRKICNGASRLLKYLSKAWWTWHQKVKPGRAGGGGKKDMFEAKQTIDDKAKEMIRKAIKWKES